MSARVARQPDRESWPDCVSERADLFAVAHLAVAMVGETIMGATKDLAPMIHRQRLVIEGYPAFAITDDHIKDYRTQLSEVTEMEVLLLPVTHCSDKYGWAGWIHWETSGAHFYAWEKPLLFFSVDIYTCKAFDPDDAARFTREYFKCTDQIHREF